MSDAVFFLCGTALPLAVMIIGFILWKNPPGINNGFGFRTKLSKSSEEAWNFAQRYSGRLMVRVSIPLLIVSAAVCGISTVCKIDSDGKFGVILLLVLIGAVTIAAVNAATDSKMKASFKETLEKRLNDNGKER